MVFTTPPLLPPKIYILLPDIEQQGPDNSFGNIALILDIVSLMQLNLYMILTI